MLCICLLYSANLRPREIQSANNRLFFGIEKKTQKEKSQNTENMKELYIVFISTEENNDYM